MGEGKLRCEGQEESISADAIRKGVGEEKIDGRELS